MLWDLAGTWCKALEVQESLQIARRLHSRATNQTLRSILPAGARRLGHYTWFCTTFVQPPRQAGVKPPLRLAVLASGTALKETVVDEEGGGQP